MVRTLFLMIFFFKIHGQIETVHFCNRATCFRHYMKVISCNFGTNASPPNQPNSEIFFSGFIHFMTTIACRHVGIWDQLVPTCFNVNLPDRFSNQSVQTNISQSGGLAIFRTLSKLYH